MKIQIDEQKQKKNRILCLDNAIDDDFYKIYYLESQTSRNKWYRITATVFGAMSCSCEEQTRISYKICNHISRLDKILQNFLDEIQTSIRFPHSF